MSEIAALFVTTSSQFLLGLFVVLWLIALVGTVYEVRRWWLNRSAYKPCEHLFVSQFSSTSDLVCFDCGDIK